MDWDGRIFVALDGLATEAACGLMSKIRESGYGKMVMAAKIHNLWDREGPGIVDRLEEAGAPGVWVDLKLHDVPDTVALRAAEVKKAGGEIVTVHASGGIEMMREAVKSGLKVLAITALTSLTEEEIYLIYGVSPKAAVLKLARMAKLADVWGVVCSVHEVGVLAKRPELEGLELVTPGIRLKGKSATDDNQKRVDSPIAAFESGATRIVLGSELTKSILPIAILDQIAVQIATLPSREGMLA